MRILISEFMDRDAIEWLEQRHETRFDPALVDDPERLLVEVTNAQALLIRNRTRITAQLLDQAPSLRVIGRLGVGLDNVDQEACKTRNVQVITAVGANTQSVAEYVICTAMMLLRGAYLHSAEVARGEWPRSTLSSGGELAGKQIGIVGFGGAGQCVARLALALGMRVHACMRNDGDATTMEGVAASALDELLAVSDVISLHVPFTESTRGLFGRRRLEAMKRGAVLINTARGGIVDEDVLAELLRGKHLGGAALDVFSEEPLRSGSSLSDVPNLILTPHIAGLTAESNRRVSWLIASEVDARLVQLFEGSAG